MRDEARRRGRATGQPLDGQAAAEVERWVVERESATGGYAVARSRAELQAFVRSMHSAGVTVRVHDVH